MAGSKVQSDLVARRGSGAGWPLFGNGRHTPVLNDDGAQLDAHIITTSTSVAAYTTAWRALTHHLQAMHQFLNHPQSPHTPPCITSTSHTTPPPPTPPPRGHPARAPTPPSPAQHYSPSSHLTAPYIPGPPIPTRHTHKPPGPPRLHAPPHHQPTTVPTNHPQSPPPHHRPLITPSNRPGPLPTAAARRPPPLPPTPFQPMCHSSSPALVHPMMLPFTRPVRRPRYTHPLHHIHP